MDDLDRTLAELRRVVIDGGVRAGVERRRQELPPTRAPHGVWTRARLPVLASLLAVLAALLLI